MTVLFTYSGEGDNASPIGDPFTTIDGFSPLQRDANTIAGTASSANNGAYVNSVAAQTDGYIQARLRSNVLTSAAVMWRVQEDEASGYLFNLFGSSLFIARFDAGSYGNLVSDTFTYAQNDVIRLEAVGTVLTAKINGVTVLDYDTAPDGTKYASGRFGLYTFSAVDGMDQIEAGDFSAGGGFHAAWARGSNVVLQ